MQLPRPIYIVWRILYQIGQILSRAFNAFVLGGSTRQTTSARMHIEAWPKGEARVDAFFTFFGAPEHCERAWEEEVKDALLTLDRLAEYEAQP